MLTDDARLVPNPARTLLGFPTIALDPAYPGMIEDFDDRVRPVPSLLHARHFEVTGELVISTPFDVRGTVKILVHQTRQVTLPKSMNVLLDAEVSLE